MKDFEGVLTGVFTGVPSECERWHCKNYESLFFENLKSEQRRWASQSDGEPWRESPCLYYFFMACKHGTRQPCFLQASACRNCFVNKSISGTFFTKTTTKIHQVSFLFQKYQLFFNSFLGSGGIISEK